MFVVFEGTDAVGKATQSKRLAEVLAQRAERRKTPAPLLLSFPRYETEVGRAILRHLHKDIMMAEERGRDSSDIRVDGDPYWARCREDALAFQCLMLADKVDASGQIVNELGRGGDVIADRWWPSAYAYGGSDGLSDEWLVRVHGTLPKPDLMLFLDLPVETAIERAMKRAEDKGKKLDRYETTERQVVIRSRYLALIEQAPAVWQKIDAVGTKDEVAARVLHAILSLEEV